MSKVTERQLSGTAWQQMTQIIEFHETRLNRLDKFAKASSEQQTNGENSELEERIQTLEEHSNMVTTSIERNSKNLSEVSSNVAEGVTKSNKSLAESKKLTTSIRVFPTKLAVMTEKFNLLSEKVDGLIGKIEALEQQLDNKSMNNITLDIEETTNSSSE